MSSAEKLHKFSSGSATIKSQFHVIKFKNKSSINNSPDLNNDIINSRKLSPVKSKKKLKVTTILTSVKDKDEEIEIKVSRI